RRSFAEKLMIFKTFPRDLQDETFVYKNQTDQNKGRQDLLDIGNWLLQNVDIAADEDLNVIFGSILFIIKRQEFNVCDMQFDVGMKPQFKSDTILTMLKYRRFLFDLQMFVQTYLIGDEMYPSYVSFCASVLAINYFYIDGLAEILLDHCFSSSQRS